MAERQMSVPPRRLHDHLDDHPLRDLEDPPISSEMIKPRKKIVTPIQKPQKVLFRGLEL